MARYDSETNQFIERPPEDIEGSPGWKRLDCHCCNGIRWGGDYPRECPDCGGEGTFYVHVATGVKADYPGGPLRGRIPVGKLATMLKGKDV